MRGIAVDFMVAAKMIGVVRLLSDSCGFLDGRKRSVTFSTILGA